MTKLSMTIEEQLNIMAKYALTAEEFLLVELLILATAEDEPRPDLLKTYFLNCKKQLPARETLVSLKDKKVLASHYDVPPSGSPFKLEDVELSKQFILTYWKESFEAGKELFMSYPAYSTINGTSYPLKNVTTKGYLTLENFFLYYAKVIRHNATTHREVMKQLEWAKEQGLLVYSMVEYVTTRKWMEHKVMQDNGTVIQGKIETLEDY